MHTGCRSRYAFPPPPPYHFNHIYTPPQRVIQETHRSRVPPVYSPSMTTRNDNVTILVITDKANEWTTTPTYSQIQKQQQDYAQLLPYSRKCFKGTPTPIASAFESVTVSYNVGNACATTQDLPIPKDPRDLVVEVNSFKNIPPSGLRVSVSTPKSDVRLLNEPILRPSVKTEASGSREQEGEERRSGIRKYEKNTGRFNRGSCRKSKITHDLLDARDRIAGRFENEVEKKKVHNVKERIKQGPFPETTLLTFFPVGDKENKDNDLSKQMGIEVGAVFHESSEIPSTSESSKLNSIQIMKIEEGGRVGKDGRIRIGDCILAIDGKFADQMSITRARASISELPSTNRPITLVLNRALDSFLEQESAKPIQSALQQANTQCIGHTTVVELVKSAKGFGFTVTSRETSKGERLFYIGTVKPYGVALGHLKSGDRLLEINETATGQFTQLEIVEKMKETMVGAKTKFLVGRVSLNEVKVKMSQTNSSFSDNKGNEEAPKNEVEKSASQKLSLPALMTSPMPNEFRFDIVIPFINGSSSAGLGVSLKARVSKKSNGTKGDCGIFIKNVMYGGAAFKEGGLRVDDRIIGVEDVNLEFFNNMEAQTALLKKLKVVGMMRSSVRLTILRDNDYHPGHISRDLSRITVDASSSHTAPDSLFRFPHTRATSSSGLDSLHSRQSSSSSANERDSIIFDSTDRHYGSELPGTDPFHREGLGRKSMKGKKGIGAHQRRNSAPTSSTQKRSKSHRRSLSQRSYRSPKEPVVLPQPPMTSTVAQHNGSDMFNRQSKRMESVNHRSLANYPLRLLQTIAH